MSLPCPNLHNSVYGNEDHEKHLIKWVKLNLVYPGNISLKFKVNRQPISRWITCWFFARHGHDFFKKIWGFWQLYQTTCFLPSNTMAFQIFFHDALVRSPEVVHTNFCRNRPIKSGEIKIFVQRQNYVHTLKDGVPHVSHRNNRLLLYSQWWLIFFFHYD